jgi:hypothetical protein
MTQPDTALLRLVTAVLVELSEDWQTGMRYLTFKNWKSKSNSETFTETKLLYLFNRFETYKLDENFTLRRSIDSILDRFVHGKSTIDSSAAAGELLKLFAKFPKWNYLATGLEERLFGLVLKSYLGSDWIQNESLNSRGKLYIRK